VPGPVDYTRNIDSNQLHVTAANIGVRVSGQTGSPLSKTLWDADFLTIFRTNKNLDVRQKSITCKL
jgi:uncharacterized protein with gpF-like domain